MFPVTGWSIGAAKPKLQTEFNAHSGPVKAKSSKRKRPNAVTVTEENVADLYESVIEGKSTKKEAKRPKLVANTATGSAAPPANQQQKKKQKNSQKSASTPANGDDTKADPPPPQQADAAGLGPPIARATRKPSHKAQAASLSDATSTAVPPPLLGVTAKLTPLQTKMGAKLESARFRYLNEALYTQPSREAAELFTSTPAMFAAYHAGFRRQVAAWPENPVDGFVALIGARANPQEAASGARGVRRGGGGGRPRAPRQDPTTGEFPPVEVQPLPASGGGRNGRGGRTVIADLGCGDATLAASVAAAQPQLPVDVRSFDLAATSPLVTAADIADLPLQDATVDVAVFCLALMGTNWLEFVEEAWRVLRPGGELWVAEIKSRFALTAGAGASAGRRVVDHSVGNKRKPPSKKALHALDEKNAEAADKILAIEVDGVEPTGKGETDVSQFMAALKRRGFLPMRASDAVQMENKMFVKMFFVKVGEPTHGKYATDHRAKEVDSGVGMKKKKIKYIEEAEIQEDIAEAEKGILKPCVYKVR